MVHMVFCGRNDIHGGTRFADKVIAILDWNVKMFQRHNLEHTFWFIEWGQEPGFDWLSPLLVQRFETCRCIMVPNEIVDAAQVPPVRFQEFIAKNIGIARAADGLVIATNSDILFSDALTRYLKTLIPDNRCIYRAPRYDFVCDGLLPVEEKDFNWTAKYDVGPNFGEAAGDFTAATPAVWEMIHGYCESPRHVRHLDSEAVVAAIYLGRRPVITPPVYHREHPESTKFSKVWKPEWGDQDEGLRTGTKIMPRNPIWGHRDCVLKVQGERLALMQVDNWPGEVRQRRDLSPENISIVLNEGYVSEEYNIRERLSRMLNRVTPISGEELQAAVEALTALLSATDIPAHIEARRGTFPEAMLPLLIINLATAWSDGNMLLAEVLERVYGLLTGEMVPYSL